jgi:hypothetical protein
VGTSWIPPGDSVRRLAAGGWLIFEAEFGEGLPASPAWRAVLCELAGLGLAACSQCGVQWVTRAERGGEALRHAPARHSAS